MVDAAKLSDLKNLIASNPVAAVDAVAAASKDPAAAPFLLANLDALIGFVGEKKCTGELKQKLQDGLEAFAKIDTISEAAVKALGVPKVADLAKNSTKWQVKVLALRVLELWASSAPDAVSESMVALVPLLSELMWDSKTQIKEQATATLKAACLSIENVDLEPFIPQLIMAISQPETVEECVQGLAATTFVQAVRAAALAITVPVLDRGLKEKKTATVRQSGKITENLAKLVKEPQDVAPFMPVLGPALAKAKQEVSDPECRARCAAAHDALLAIGSFDEAAQKKAKAAEDKTLAAATDAAKAVLKGQPDAVITFAAYAAAGLSGVSDAETWKDQILPGISSVGKDAAEKAVKELHAKLAAKATTTEAVEVIEEDDSGGELLCDCRFSLAYGSKILLNSARMRLVRGRRYGLIGLKAAGKTTLLKAIANNQVEGFPPPDKLKTHFLEADVLHSPLTVVEFVFESLKDIEPGLTKERVEQGLRQVGFDDHHLGLPVWNLSGGWRIKTAVARAMIRNADILLMDQPTNHLDVKNVQWVVDYLTGEHMKNVTCLIVTHDLGFANKVCTNIIHFTPQLKLDSYVGNMEVFFTKHHPELANMFDISVSDQPFNFPPPAPIEGLKNRGAKCLSLEHVTFQYPGTDKPQLIDVSVRVSMASRVCCSGMNGAGKSTLIKLLMGALTPTQGTVYKHPNVRVAYVGQHAFEYIQDHLSKTANEYIRWRYADGDDKEALTKSNMILTEEEQKKVDTPIEVVYQDEDGKNIKEKRVVERLVGRRKGGSGKSSLEYEIKWKNKIQDYNTWMSREELIERGFEKLVAALDRKKLAAEGAYSRTLTQKNVEDHLQGVGLDSESATHTRMSQLSSGQRIKVVLAAAMWYLPHVLILDEPTNYASRDDIAALGRAIIDWQGGVVLITHSQEFAKLTTRENWVVADHKCIISGEADWTALEKEAMELGMNYKEEDQLDASGNKVDRSKKREPSDVKPKEKKELTKTIKTKLAADAELTEFEYACATAWSLW